MKNVLLDFFTVISLFLCMVSCSSSDDEESVSTATLMGTYSYYPYEFVFNADGTGTFTSTLTTLVSKATFDYSIAGSTIKCSGVYSSVFDDGTINSINPQWTQTLTYSGGTMRWGSTLLLKENYTLSESDVVNWPDADLGEDFAPDNLDYTTFNDNNNIFSVSFKDNDNVVDVESNGNSTSDYSGSYKKISENKASMTFNCTTSSNKLSANLTLHYNGSESGICDGTLTQGSLTKRIRSRFYISSYSSFAPSSIAGMTFAVGSMVVRFDSSGNGCEYLSDSNHSNCHYTYSPNGGTAVIRISYLYRGVVSSSVRYVLTFKAPHRGTADDAGGGMAFSLN